MIEIVKTYKERLPAVRLIGKRYTDADRLNGSYGHKWGEFFQNGWFDLLQSLGSVPENEDAYMGFMRHFEGRFEYWIGMFLPAGTPAPEGFEWIDLPALETGICWIRGRDETGEIYGMQAHKLCVKNMREAGYILGDVAFFERYNCPRFTEKDADGKVILDYGIYLA